MCNIHNNDSEIENGVLIKYKGNAENVEIPGGIYSIGSGAFEDNGLLKNVTIPDSVTSIEDYAFA